MKDSINKATISKKNMNKAIYPARLKVGDEIRVVGGETDFNQVVESMEVDHKKVKEAKKGDEVGMKVGQKVREGYRAYKL